MNTTDATTGVTALCGHDPTQGSGWSVPCVSIQLTLSQGSSDDTHVLHGKV